MSAPDPAGSGRPSPEPELTDPVALCTPQGRLNPAAVGWSRQPVHDSALPGRWGRRKRWDYWGVIGPDHALSLTFADVDYAGIVDLWFCDLTTGEAVNRSVPLPLAKGIALPDDVGGGPIRYRGSTLEASAVEEEGGTRLQVSFGGSDPTPDGQGSNRWTFEADILVRRPQVHESLSVVIPWSERRFQLTTKDGARPAEGTVRWRGATYPFEPDGRSWGFLDFGRGRWPYRTRWNWGAGAGVVDGPNGPTTVGVQVGGKWTEGTGMTENALYVDGRLTKVPEELLWSYDRDDWLAPWTIRTPHSDQVDLTFTPSYDKPSRLQLGVAAQSVNQLFGTYRGTIRPDGSAPLHIDGVRGWAEEATWRW